MFVCTIAVFPTLPCNPFLRMCKTFVTHTAIPHCPFLLCECLIDRPERTMPEVLQQLQKPDHKLPKSLSANSHQRALWSPFPSFSRAQSPFCFISAVEYTKAGDHNCVVCSLMLSRALPTPSIAQGGHKAGGHQFSHCTAEMCVCYT